MEYCEKCSHVMKINQNFCWTDFEVAYCVQLKKTDSVWFARKHNAV